MPADNYPPTEEIVWATLRVYPPPSGHPSPFALGWAGTVRENPVTIDAPPPTDDDKIGTDTICSELGL